jgi:hypothetical protein
LAGAAVVRLSAVWLWIATALAMVIALTSYRYVMPGMPGAAANVVANRFTSTGALVVHAGFAATALALGALQLFPRFRAGWPAWHRRAGTVYVTACMIAGAAGLLLALGTTAGPIGAAGFGALDVLWIGCTANAWRYARARDFVSHRRWMIRSYALTFAAVTLRIYLPIAIIARLNVGEAYQAISFLCWVPNLVVAELWLRFGQGVRTNRPIAVPSQSPG